MNGTQVTSTSDIDRRIAMLDEGARRILQFHSGTRPDGPKLLLEALEAYFNQNPAVPVILIQRKVSHEGKQGRMETVTCGICGKIGTFQKIADHIVNEHFKLSLWYCGVNGCRIALTRKSDLDRHRCAVHHLARPREVKAERRSRFSSPIDAPSPPLLSPGPGPTRNSGSTSRGREPSASRSYPTHSTFAASVSGEDINNRPNDNVLSTNIQPRSAPSYLEDSATHPLMFDHHVHPTLVLPPTVPPTIPSLPDNGSHLLYAAHPGGSSSGLGRRDTSLDATSPSELEAAYPLQSSAPSRPVEPSHAFDRYDSSNFLSPPPLTPMASSSGIGLSPLPAPIYRVATPRQSKSPHLGTYHALNPTQRTQLPPSSLNPHYSSISESSQCLMTPHSLTSSQQYYPHRAQINMQNAVPGGHPPAGYWGSTFGGPPSRPYTPYPVDDEFDFNLGTPDVLFSPRGPTQ